MMNKETQNKESPSLEERITKLEILLEGDDQEPTNSNWSYHQIRTILDKSGLAPNMARNQELCGLDERVDILEGVVSSINELLESLGQTDSHIGEKTLKYRLDMIEGCLSILHSAHKGHTNYEEVEYYGMHERLESKRGQLEGIQKKLDRISKLLNNTKFEISYDEAMKL